MTLDDSSSEAIRKFKKRKFEEHKAKRQTNKYPEGFGDDAPDEYSAPPKKFPKKEFKKDLKRPPKGPPNEQKEKPDWKKFKSEKKEQKVHRQMKKDDNYEIGIKAKKIWEELRQGNCKGARRQELCDHLMSLVKGKVKNLIFAHDTVRVIETLMAVGTEKHRSFLFEEMKDSIVDLSKSKYSKFFVLKMLKYGTKEEKNSIMTALKGQVVKLMKHKTASDIIELAYNDYANAKQRSLFVQEFYGPEFRLFHDESVQCLDDAFTKHPLKKDYILKDMRKYLQPIVEKGVFTNTMVHTLLRDFLTHCSKDNRTAMIESLREGLAPIIHTRDGARVAMLCLWHGTSKDRKVILKSLRTHFVKIALEEHGYMVLLAAFDCVDDTEFMRKAVLSELMEDIPQLVSSDSGMKVLRYLIAPREPMFFPPCIVKVLEQGDGNDASKKDTPLRRSELQRAVSVPILRMLLSNIKDWAVNSNWTLFIGAALSSLFASEAQGIFEALAKMFAQEYIPGDENHPLEIAHTVKMATYIIKTDRKRDKALKPTFCACLLKFAEKEMLGWINCNRGCFLLVNMIETEVVGVSSKVKNMIAPLKDKLLTLQFKGAEVLLKKL
ncbi:hypothetical protein SK128_026774 [Halocaridina rubra]|uniref:PUM-HD domain-containing protein n=1 Tax=Halocaridina rubra TaxID=373956 RepID=A0AAN9A226_HALRR